MKKDRIKFAFINFERMYGMKNKKLSKRIDDFIENSHENPDTRPLVKGSFYFTENPVNYDDRYYGKKYFFCYHNTHTVMQAFKSQREIEEFLSEYGF